MKSSLKGRVKNLVLSKSNGLLPLFEAVVNSIQAIEDRYPNAKDIREKGKIDIYILRKETQAELELALGRPPERPITSFEVIDNGVGFDDRNWSSFQELDFTRKTQRGCRGVGRLTWLKAFNNIKVESWYSDDDEIKPRWFNFSTEKEDEPFDPPKGTPIGQVGSKVVFDGFQEGYAVAVEKTSDAIASRLLGHLLWYYVRAAGVPTIIIHDDGAEAPINLNTVFDAERITDSKNEDFAIKGAKFNITHVKLRVKANRKHVIAYCAAQRLVKEEVLDIPGLTASIEDDNGNFRYSGYVVGDYLDQRVHPERTDIEMAEEVTGLFSQSEVSRSDLRDALRPMVEKYLGDALSKNLKAGQKRLDTYLEKVAPQYLPIVKTLPKDAIRVDPGVSDAKLDRLLHEKKYEVEQDLLKQGEKLLTPDLSENHDDYNERVSSYLNQLERVKQSDLAAYVAHRRVVIDLLRKAMEIQEDGRYAREEVLHSLIMPMGTTSEDLESLRGSNLWLIDERLAFHQHYLGSDKSLSSIPVTGASGGKEPDLVGLNIFDWVHENPHAFSDTENTVQAAITIVELKRPMKGGHRPGEEKDPIAQAFGYLRRIRDGGVMSKSQRHIANASTLPAQVYVVADLTPSLKVQCENASLLTAPDGLSYFGYNSGVRAFVEVIDFQGLLSHATERNAAFFDRLGLPSSG